MKTVMKMLASALMVVGLSSAPAIYAQSAKASIGNMEVEGTSAAGSGVMATEACPGRPNTKLCQNWSRPK